MVHFTQKCARSLLPRGLDRYLQVRCQGSHAALKLLELSSALLHLAFQGNNSCLHLLLTPFGFYKLCFVGICKQAIPSSCQEAADLLERSGVLNHSSEDGCMTSLEDRLEELTKSAARARSDLQIVTTLPAQRQ